MASHHRQGRFKANNKIQPDYAFRLMFFISRAVYLQIHTFTIFENTPLNGFYVTLTRSSLILEDSLWADLLSVVKGLDNRKIMHNESRCTCPLQVTNTTSLRIDRTWK